MRRTWFPLILLVVTGLALVLANAGMGSSGGAPLDPRARIGLQIAPLPLNVVGKNKEMVGLGSYMLNTVGNCNDCHSVMEYLPGHNPFLGEQEQIDPATYLTGGRAFGNVLSRNLRPEIGTGLPAGLTYDQFVDAMRHGADADHHGKLLQVMPWPDLQSMMDQDLRAIYEYLWSLPAVPPPGG